LHGSRQAGFSGGEAITLSDISAYCALCGFGDPSFRLEFMTMVQAMDDEWLTIQAEKPKK